MFAVSRDAGRYAISEPELQAHLAELAASGRLRCALCDGALAPEDVALVRRPLPHRWATLPAHQACAHGAGADPARPRARAAHPSKQAPEGVGRGGLPLARLGRLAGRLALAAASLEYADETGVGEALIGLGLGDALPVQDFDPAAGIGVRALHAAFPDLPVFVVPGLRVNIAEEAEGLWRISVWTGGGTLQGLGEGSRAAFAPALAEGGCVVLLVARSSFSGPEQPAAALLLPPPGRP